MLLPSWRLSFSVALVCLMLSNAASGRVRPFDETKVTEAAQDSAGIVWGISYYTGFGLYRWEGDHWKSVPFPGSAANAWPNALASGSDGRVYCLWNFETDEHAITWHRGESAGVLGSFKGPLSRPRLFADAGGNIWVTESGRHIFRVTAEGKGERAYTIANGQFHEYGRPEEEQSSFNPVHATLDRLGRPWFWSNTLAGGTNIASLQGVLVYDHNRLEHFPTIAGVPDKKYSVLAAKDSRHMWLAVEDDGLYEVAISTMTATPASEPEDGAFRFVQRIFEEGKDTYLIAGSVWEPVSDPRGNGRTGSLWRLHNGRWEKLVSGIDKRTEYGLHSSRSWLPTGEGLLLGTFGSGPWLVSSGGPPARLLDWRSGFPLANSGYLFRLSDDRILIVASNEGSLKIKSDDLLARGKVAEGVQVLKTYRPLKQDLRGQIWAMVFPGENALSEWDGGQWRKHFLPEGLVAEGLATICIDSYERIWLLPAFREGPAGIFDPAAGTWEVFASYPAALEAQLESRNGLGMEPREYMGATFSPDGRICFRDAWSKVVYFDGRRWHRWSRKGIKGDDNFVLDGPPFFSRAGNLAVNIEGRTWQFTEQHGWHTASYEPGLGPDRPRELVKTGPPPPGCDVVSTDSLVRDSWGAYWFTWRRQLYRGIYGVCLPRFAPDENHPFIEPRRLVEVLTDSGGNTLLNTVLSPDSAVEEWVILQGKEPLPDTVLHVTRESEDSVTLSFSNRVEGASRFIWRMDEEPWSAPTRETRVRVDHLPNGRHRFEAVAIDGSLQFDPTPANLTVEISADPKRQIADLIARLAAPDYGQREAAVAALARQPALALPALRKARATASSDQRWWIDSAIQQIEEIAKNDAAAR